MKICFVNDSFSGRGGANRVVIQIANALDEDGFSISLIDFSGKNQFDFPVNPNIKIPKVIRKKNIIRKMIKVPLYLYNYLTSKNINVNSLYKEQVKDLLLHLSETEYDLIILCQGVLTSFIPDIKKEIPNLKVIAWQHNEFEIYTKKYYHRFLDQYIKGLEMSNYIVCLTERDNNQFSLINSNSRNIYNPLTIENTELNLSKLENKNIIFVGNLAIEQKGLDILIEIAKKINPETKIFIAGDGKDREKFELLIADNNLQTKIILKGSLNDHKLIQHYLSGSIFISTSRWEGFGLVLTEAMSFGLPIISFKTNGPIEILENGNYGILIDKYNIEEFASEINSLLDSDKKLLTYQQKSLLRVKDFKKENILNEWKQLIYEIMNKIE